MFWLDRKLTLYSSKQTKIHCAWKTFKSHKWELTFKINTNSYKDSLNFVQVSPAILPGLKRWSICLLIPSLGFPSLICNKRLKRLDSSQILTFRLDDNKLRLISHWYLEIINSSGTFSTWVCPSCLATCRHRWQRQFRDQKVYLHTQFDTSALSAVKILCGQERIAN